MQGEGKVILLLQIRQFVGQMRPIPSGMLLD